MSQPLPQRRPLFRMSRESYFLFFNIFQSHDVFVAGAGNFGGIPLFDEGVVSPRLTMGALQADPGLEIIPGLTEEIFTDTSIGILCEGMSVPEPNGPRRYLEEDPGLFRLACSSSPQPDSLVLQASRGSSNLITAPFHVGELCARSAGKAPPRSADDRSGCRACWRSATLITCPVLSPKYPSRSPPRPTPGPTPSRGTRSMAHVVNDRAARGVPTRSLVPPAYAQAYCNDRLPAHGPVARGATRRPRMGADCGPCGGPRPRLWQRRRRGDRRLQHGSLARPFHR